MAALEEFDREVKELVTSGKLSSSKIKSVTDAAMANIASDAHLVATLFKVHKQAKSSHKISSLYVIDAIAREARQQVKKASKGKQSSSGIATPLHDGAGSGANDDSDEPTLGKRSTKGTYASFLSKIESFLDRLVAEVLSKGPPEHKDKVKKVLDIWKKSTTFSSDALKPCYARLADEVPEANAATKKSNSNRSATASSGQRSTTPPYPPPDKPIRFPPFPPSFHLNNATPPLFPTQDNTQSTDLAALLGSISASQILPAATAVAPLQPPAPTFEVSQLALLQQLAAQSSSASPFDAPPAVGTAPLAAPMSMPTTFPMPPQMPVPVAAPSFNNDVTQQARSLAPTNGWGGPSGPSQQTRQPSPPREARDRRSQWDRDSRPQAREGRDRRSVSPETERYGQRRQRSPPPARQRSPPYREARQDGWSTRDGKRSTSSRFEQTQSHAAPARQQETRRIATYISEERSDERPGGKGKDARRGADVEDYSSFEVLPSQDGSNSHGQSFLSNNNTQWQPSEEEKAAEELMNSAPNFNPMTFNAADPQSWASFAHMCSNNMGRMPSTMEMMQWIMSSMAMMQAQMSAGGMMMGGMPGNMQGDVSMQGMQDMHNFASFGGNQGSGMGMGMDASSSNNTESWNNYGQQDSKESEPGADASEKQQARDSSIGPDTRPPIPTRDHGEGEEDMQMTPDPEG